MVAKCYSAFLSRQSPSDSKDFLNQTFKCPASQQFREGEGGGGARRRAKASSDIRCFFAGGWLPESMVVGCFGIFALYERRKERKK